MMTSILSIQNVSKVYDDGFQALTDIDLKINEGEIFALLGPNGAGKTTLINLICGIATLTKGTIVADGFDVVSQYRETRARIGLVPQELLIDTFATVWQTVSFSRGLFGKKRNDAYLEKILKDLSLWDKKDQRLLTLSGGMKRRVLIAKALAHEPSILFLDEPTAGVDVELRKNMWDLVRELRTKGVTIILTTHYIQEAEEMADRVGVINHGKLLLVEEKSALMKKMGKKKVSFALASPLENIPASLAKYDLKINASKEEISYTNSTHTLNNQLPQLMADLESANINWKDFSTKQSSLEEIFVQMVDRS